MAENPISPLEPLASYGKILRGLREVTEHIDEVLLLQPQMIAWAKQREEISIFPLLESVFASTNDIYGVFQ